MPTILSQQPCPFCVKGRRPMEAIAEARGISVERLIEQICDGTFHPSHMIADFDLKEHTVICLHCDGSGTREKVVEENI